MHILERACSLSSICMSAFAAAPSLQANLAFSALLVATALLQDVSSCNKSAAYTCSNDDCCRAAFIQHDPKMHGSCSPRLQLAWRYAACTLQHTCIAASRGLQGFWKSRGCPHYANPQFCRVCRAVCVGYTSNVLMLRQFCVGFEPCPWG